MKKEIFKKINDPMCNYEVSNFGNVRNIKNKINLKPDISNMGYKRVNLYIPKLKKQVKYSIHKLVARYFVDNPNPDKFTIINHIDGNKLNCRADNLEWCDYSYNLKHAYKNNLKNENGTNNPANIYNEDDIIHICKLIKNNKNLSTKAISLKVFNDYNNKYKSLINHIKNKTRWKELSDNYF